MAKEKVPFFVREATGLIRSFGPWTAFALSFSFVVGAGVFAFSIQSDFLYPGSNIFLVFLIATVPMVIVSLVYSWMGMAMPRTGGDYVYVSRLINPLVGWLIGWLYFLGRWLVIGVLVFTDASFWGLTFVISGLASGNQGLVSLGRAISTNPTNGVIISLVLLATIWVLVSYGGRPLRWYLWTLFIIPLLTGIASIVVFIAAAVTAPSIQSVWDALFGSGAYQEIVSVALATGWHASSFNWSATIAALPVAIFAFGVAPLAPTVLGGEIASPKRAFYISVAGSALAAGIFMAILAYSPHVYYGNFISMADWDFYTKSAHAMLHVNRILNPILPFFVVPLTNPVVAIVLLIGAAFTLYHIVPPAVMAGSRYVLSMSFDRFFPERFSNVNEKLHTPVWAISFIVVGGLLGVFLNAYSGFTVAIFPITTINTVTMVIGCIAGILLPSKMPQAFKGAGAGAKRFFGVPLIIILGVIGAVIQAFFAYITISESTPFSLSVTVVAVIVGVVIYTLYYYYNKRRGIEPRSIYSEVPPE